MWWSAVLPPGLHLNSKERKSGSRGGHPCLKGGFIERIHLLEANKRSFIIFYKRIRLTCSKKLMAILYSGKKEEFWEQYSSTTKILNLTFLFNFIKIFRNNIANLLKSINAVAASKQQNLINNMLWKFKPGIPRK